MYICSCHAVTDGQIRKAVDGGISRWKDLVNLLHCSTQCGICGKEAKSLFDKFLKERREREKKAQTQIPDQTAETPAPAAAASCAGNGSGCAACPKRAICPAVGATSEQPTE